MRRKNKKDLYKIVVEVKDERGDSEVSVKEFDVPKGGKCIIETIGGDLVIKDKYGFVIKHVNWQAGFTQEYDFLYRE